MNRARIAEQALREGAALLAVSDELAAIANTKDGDTFVAISLIARRLREDAATKFGAAWKMMNPSANPMPPSETLLDHITRHVNASGITSTTGAGSNG